MQIIYGKWSIKARSVNEDDFKYVLGRYKTEERAKEVLQEIIQKTEDLSLANLMENLQLAIHGTNFSGTLSNTFYMPEDQPMKQLKEMPGICVNTVQAV